MAESTTYDMKTAFNILKISYNQESQQKQQISPLMVMSKKSLFSPKQVFHNAMHQPFVRPPVVSLLRGLVALQKKIKM